MLITLIIISILMVNFLSKIDSIKRKHTLTQKARNLIFYVWAAILVLISQPKELSSQTQQQYSSHSNDEESKKMAWLSIIAKKIIDWLPEDYQKEVHKLIWDKRFNFTPAWAITSKKDLDKIASDLSKAPTRSFSEISWSAKYSRENVNAIIRDIFNPIDSETWLRKWFEKRAPTPDELEKYKNWIIISWNNYLEKIKVWWKWDSEIWEKKLDWKVFDDFESLFNYWISKIPPQLQTREVYRRLFVASASLAEYKNSLNKNENNLPIVATQVSEYISLISVEQNSEKLYIRDWETYRLPSDQDIDILWKESIIIRFFSWIWTKALAVLIKKNSSSVLEDLSKIPTPPTSWLWWWKKSEGISNQNNWWNILPESSRATPQVWTQTIDDLIKSIWEWWSGKKWNWTKPTAWTWLLTESASMLKKLATERNEEEDKIREAKRIIDEIDAESQKLAAERDELLWKIADEENAISRELYDFWNQCSTIIPASESLKRDLRWSPKKIDNIPEWIWKIDVANSNIANTSLSIKWRYKSIIWYENRINEINKAISENNAKIITQEKIIENSKKAIREIDSNSK